MFSHNSPLYEVKTKNGFLTAVPHFPTVLTLVAVDTLFAYLLPQEGAAGAEQADAWLRPEAFLHYTQFLTNTLRAFWMHTIPQAHF